MIFNTTLAVYHYCAYRASKASIVSRKRIKMQQEIQNQLCQNTALLAQQSQRTESWQKSNFPQCDTLAYQVPTTEGLGNKGC